MYYKDAVFAAMSELRITVDELETVVPADIWGPEFAKSEFKYKKHPEICIDRKSTRLNSSHT